MEEKELFQDYELRSWELSPRIYKILGMAAALHLFGLIVFSQVDLLGTKACDSPYVGKVCQVLDAAYISSVLLGTETEFSNRDYDKTEIDEADVTWVDVSEQFTYPAGYFAQSNPEPMYDPTLMGGDPTGTMPTSIPGFPGFTPSSPSMLDPNAPVILPTPNPNPVQGELPDFTIKSGNPTTVNPTRIPRPRTQRFPIPRTPKNNTSPNSLPKLDGTNETASKDKNSNSNTNANKDPKANSETPKKDEQKMFNQKPLRDFGEKYGTKILKNEVNLNAPFSIEVIAKLDENGKLINPKMASTADSDPKMTEIAKEAILAFGDSQLLLTLYDAVTQNEPGQPTIRIKFVQDADNLQANIQVEAKSENKAKQIQSGLSFLLTLKKPKEGTDERNLLDKAVLGTNGKNFVISFLIANEEKTALIRKHLEKQQQENQNLSKPSSGGGAETADKDIKSAK
jgi:hypothetical protein